MRLNEFERLSKQTLVADEAIDDPLRMPCRMLLLGESRGRRGVESCNPERCESR